MEIDKLRKSNEQLREENNRQEEQRDKAKELVGVATLEREELLSAAVQIEVACTKEGGSGRGEQKAEGVGAGAYFFSEA